MNPVLESRPGLASCFVTSDCTFSGRELGPAGHLLKIYLMLSLCEVGILPPSLTGNGLQREEVTCLGDREVLSSLSPNGHNLGRQVGGFHAPSLQLWELPLVWAGVGFLFKVWGLSVLGGGSCCWSCLRWAQLQRPSSSGSEACLSAPYEWGAPPLCGERFRPCPPVSFLPRAPPLPRLFPFSRPPPAPPTSAGVRLLRWSARAGRRDA